MKKHYLRNAAIVAVVALAATAGVAKATTGSTPTKSVTKLCAYVQGGKGVNAGDLNIKGGAKKVCIVGKPGQAGTNGIAGANGSDGAAGVNGSNGSNGTAGERGARGPQGEQGPQGEPGAAGQDAHLTTYLRKIQVQIPAGQKAEGTAACDAGDLVTGGGYSSNDQTNGWAKVYQNRMTWVNTGNENTPDGWYAQALGGDVASDMYVWAICTTA